MKWVFWTDHRAKYTKAKDDWVILSSLDQSQSNHGLLSTQKWKMHSHCYDGCNWVQVGNQNSNFWNTSCKNQGTSWLTRLRTMSKDIQKWNQIVSSNSLQQPGCTAKKINEVVSENIQRWSWKKKQKINRHLSIKRIFALHDHLSHAILYNLGEKFCYSSF